MIFQKFNIHETISSTLELNCGKKSGEIPACQWSGDWILKCTVTVFAVATGEVGLVSFPVTVNDRPGAVACSESSRMTESMVAIG